MRILSLGLSASLVFLGACTMLGRVGPEPSPPPTAEGGAEVLRIPAGHLPPPGQCRVWRPGTPPGHQTPSGPCAALRRDVPPGAWLVYRAEDKASEVAVNVYGSRSSRAVVETRYFDYWTGRLLRVEGRR